MHGTVSLSVFRLTKFLTLELKVVVCATCPMRLDNVSSFVGDGDYLARPSVEISGVICECTDLLSRSQ